MERNVPEEGPEQCPGGQRPLRGAGMLSLLGQERGPGRAGDVVRIEYCGGTLLFSQRNVNSSLVWVVGDKSVVGCLRGEDM